jgi:hypothetical protein
MVAALAFLIVSTAAVIPSHSHDCSQDIQDRHCNLCRSVHIPTLEALVRTEIQSLAPAGWYRQPAELHPIVEPVFTLSSPRAPPA